MNNTNIIIHKFRLLLEKRRTSICGKFTNKHKTFKIGEIVQKIRENPVDSFSYKFRWKVFQEVYGEERTISYSIHLF